MKNSNILIITSSNFPFGGAPANYVRLLADGLSLQGHTVKVLIQGGMQYGTQKVGFAKKGIFKNISYEYCCFANRPKSVVFKLIDNIISAIYPIWYIFINGITGRLNFVIFYTGSTYLALPSLICCKLTLIKTIGIIVEWFEKKTYLSSTIRYLKWWDYMIYMKLICRHFSRLIVTSRFLKNTYTYYGYQPEHILILPNLTDIEWFQKNKSTIIMPANSNFRIGYAGTPCHKDGIDILLDAFKIVQSTSAYSELIIIGDETGRISVIPDLQDKCRKLGIENNVIFTGLVDYAKMPDLLRTCDILILARPAGIFAEAGFPTKLGEYFALKKPVVLTKVGDLPYYLEDGYHAVFAEENTAIAIAQKINFLISNIDEAKQIGLHGFEWASEMLDYKSVSIKVDKFLKSTIKQKISI
jgi:glycosyltransferase involved in cell wall biosynthesis